MPEVPEATARDLESLRLTAGRAPDSTALASATAPPLKWSRKELAGRLAELSSVGPGASLTMAFGLVVEAQLEGEPVCWITTLDSSFFPPDAAGSGVDLAALAVIRTRDGRAAARAADKVVRCGAFGLVVIDLWSAGPGVSVPNPLQSRLLGLAGKHEAALLFLTRKQDDAASIGPLVSLRARATRTHAAEGRFMCDVEVLKDKRRGPGWTHCEVRHAPSGLR